jgi:hypothetical protein
MTVWFYVHEANCFIYALTAPVRELVSTIVKDSGRKESNDVRDSKDKRVKTVGADLRVCPCDGVISVS